jgi:hypothetical protein
MRFGAFAVALLVGCNGGDGSSTTDPNADPDGDGLTNGEEADLGLDPADPDTDHDGLWDGDELQAGTDPKNGDTDGDTYLDFDELETGHDPLNADDRIYEGYWPYNRDKDQLVDPGFDGEPLRVDDAFPRVPRSKDQYGQDVDLFDWGGTDRLTVVEATATWCTACFAMSGFISGTDDPYQLGQFYQPILDGIADGRVRWVTIVSDTGGPGSGPLDAKAWHDQYPNDRVAVLSDPDGLVEAAMNLDVSYNGHEVSTFPMCMAVDGDFVVRSRDLCWNVMDYVLANTPDLQTR